MPVLSAVGYECGAECGAVQCPVLSADSSAVGAVAVLSADSSAVGAVPMLSAVSSAEC